MQIVYSEDHKLRNSQVEFYGGELIEPFEYAGRIDYVVNEIKQRQFGELIPTKTYSLDPVLAVHSKAYIDFLSTAWQRWKDCGYEGEAFATSFPIRSMPSDSPPSHIDAQLGYYCLSSEASISEGTYEAALISKDVALTGMDIILNGDNSAFSLCRPPGHHADKDQFGGYCFFNNASIAAQHARDNGAKKVAILDVDFHHGNGTQQIFYDRDDVMVLSLHGDPDQEYPYFSGYKNETGTGQGEGFNHNYPMPAGTGFDVWSANLKDAISKIAEYAPDYLVVSLGVDTFENDPISSFKLKCDDFTAYGKDIASLNLPTLFIMEGGYAVEEIGINTVNVLQGFSNA